MAHYAHTLTSRDRASRLQALCLCCPVADWGVAVLSLPSPVRACSHQGSGVAAGQADRNTTVEQVS